MDSNSFTLEQLWLFFKQPFICFGATLIVGILIGFTLNSVIYQKRLKTPFTEVRNPGNFRFISPLVECENVDPSYSKNITSLEKAMRKKITAYKEEQSVTDVGYYFRDLTNGPWIAVNPDLDFSPASLIKVPVAMTFYKLAEDDPEILSKKIRNETPDVAKGQNISPEILLKLDTEYTIAELIEIMLVYSSNRAYELLLAELQETKPASLEQVYEELGITLPIQLRADSGASFLSVKEYASFFRALYNATYLTEENSEIVLTTLVSSQYTEGIVAGVPPSIGVAHKFGERYYPESGEVQLHDCGIIYDDTQPYLLCIMTRGSDFETVNNIIVDLTQETHRIFTE